MKKHNNDTSTKQNIELNMNFIKQQKQDYNFLSLFKHNSLLQLPNLPESYEAPKTNSTHVSLRYYVFFSTLLLSISILLICIVSALYQGYYIEIKWGYIDCNINLSLISLDL